MSIYTEALPENAKPYLCILPDKENSNRLQVRPQHLQDAKIGHKNGHIVTGGATLSDDSSSPSMTGSWMIIKATSAEDAKRKILGDVYVTGGAWDPEKIKITPIAVADLS